MLHKYLPYSLYKRLKSIQLRLKILISNKDKDIISDDSIEEILLNSIAKFKCPARYIWLDELPRNAMGKVQKKVLKEKYSKIFKEIK
jgi:acyl-CoA synthetase (AMP-forming)/AMP-acid ligase II